MLRDEEHVVRGRLKAVLLEREQEAVQNVRGDFKRDEEHVVHSY